MHWAMSAKLFREYKIYLKYTQRFWLGKLYFFLNYALLLGFNRLVERILADFKEYTMWRINCPTGIYEIWIFAIISLTYCQMEIKRHCIHLSLNINMNK